MSRTPIHYPRATCVVCGAKDIAHTGAGLAVGLHRSGMKHQAALRALGVDFLDYSEEREREAMTRASTRSLGSTITHLDEHWSETMRELAK